MKNFIKKLESEIERYSDMHSNLECISALVRITDHGSILVTLDGAGASDEEQDVEYSIEFKEGCLVAKKEDVQILLTFEADNFNEDASRSAEFVLEVFGLLPKKNTSL